MALQKLSLHLFGKKALPVLLQTETMECGVACLGMVAGYYGYHTDMASLRGRFPISMRGVTLTSIIAIARKLNLGSRSVRVDMDELDQLTLPCVLHWNHVHFVVLKEVRSDAVIIHDPAIGVRKLSQREVSDSFTGIALELWPNEGFMPLESKQSVPLRSLMGRIDGLGRSLSQIFSLAACLEVFGLISPLFLQWVIDEVIVSGDQTLLVTMAMGFGLLLLMQQTFSVARSWLITYLGTTVNLQWRANAFAHLIRLPIAYFEKRHLGDVVSRFSGIDQIQRTLTTSFIEAFLDGAMAIATLAMMFMYSKVLVAISVACTTVYWLMRWLWYRPLRAANEESIIHGSRQQSHFLESMRGVKAIKLFQREDLRQTVWSNLVADSMNATIRVQRLQLLFRFISGLLVGIENIIVLWAGTQSVLDGGFSVGALMAFSAYKGQFDSRVGSLIDKYFEWRMLQVQAERLADILHTPTEADGEQMAVPDPAILDAPAIRVEGLKFRYAEHEPWVLNGVSFVIEAGESVAIVGPSGCGKTTLINVLLGLLTPTEGFVCVGSQSIRGGDMTGLRRIAGTVLQDDVLFAGSIADNICFFDPEPDDAWIAECARYAAIAGEIDAMPMKYHTLVGDMGTVLSGGQKQRVLLARALYRRPTILFLDEATSHLDIEKERAVNAAVGELNITRVIIAHRPETVASAGRIINLERVSALAANTALVA